MFQKETVEFGECAWYLKPKSVRRNKADARWKDGIWLGIRDRSGESLVGAEHGVIKVRSVRRKSTQE